MGRGLVWGWTNRQGMAADSPRKEKNVYLQGELFHQLNREGATEEKRGFARTSKNKGKVLVTQRKYVLGVFVGGLCHVKRKKKTFSAAGDLASGESEENLKNQLKTQWRTPAGVR